LAHKKTLQLHQMQRAFIVFSIWLLSWGTHPKPAGRDPEHGEGWGIFQQTLLGALPS
jgi:hypothetical protein